MMPYSWDSLLNSSIARRPLNTVIVGKQKTTEEVRVMKRGKGDLD